MLEMGLFTCSAALSMMRYDTFNARKKIDLWREYCEGWKRVTTRVRMSRPMGGKDQSEGIDFSFMLQTDGISAAAQLLIGKSHYCCM